jgi:hypothetical protein
LTERVLVYLLKSDCVYRLRWRLSAVSPGVRMPHMLAATARFDAAHRGQPTRQSIQSRLCQGFAGQSCRNLPAAGKLARPRLHSEHRSGRREIRNLPAAGRSAIRPATSLGTAQYHRRRGFFLDPAGLRALTPRAEWNNLNN